jgi:hypothetical protein
MPEFHLTVMGHRFYESTMPSLVRAVESLNKKLDTLVEGAQSNQIEDERAAAMFAMRESIAHAIEVGFGELIACDRAALVEAIRNVQFPQHAAESVGAEQEGR